MYNPNIKGIRHPLRRWSISDKGIGFIFLLGDSVSGRQNRYGYKRTGKRAFAAERFPR
jgi:hypothetical protein